jgi:hypothetical protein
VRSAETQDLPDSLFADPKLQGFRLGLRMRLSPTLRIGGHLGFRDREDVEKRPVFANADLSWGNLLGSRVDLVARYAYADGRFTRSHVPSLDLRRDFGTRLALGIGFGAQTYDEIDNGNKTLQGQWLRLLGTFLITRRSDLQWLYTRATGDVAEGTSVYLRLGYRW